MRKIGIVTFYYSSINYGGNLQAYALCKYLNSLGFEAEQISLSLGKKVTNEGFLHKLKRKGLSQSVSDIVERAEKLINKNKLVAIRKLKTKVFFEFQKAIPHTDKVYNYDNISSLSDKYDVYITGSDQVWNSYDKVYFLDFAESLKTKLSYAANTAKGFWTEEEKNAIKKSLASFNGVSVRDRATFNDVKNVSGISSEIVVDPTLLLTKEEWDKIKKEYSIKSKYVFSYFLGNNTKARKCVEEYATKHNLEIINIPMAKGGISSADRHYGKAVFDASPGQFLYLIDNAECVFTDSFHCVIFSHLYKKQYFAFNRNRKGAMSSRLRDLTAIFETENRFCDTGSKEKLQYIESVKKIEYDSEFSELGKRITASKEFITNNLLDS